jgi:hypothetical protein
LPAFSVRPLIYFNDIEYIVKVLFNDNSYLLIGLNVENINDRCVGNLTYIKKQALAKSQTSSEEGAMRKLYYIYFTIINRIPNGNVDWLCTLHVRGGISYIGV